VSSVVNFRGETGTQFPDGQKNAFTVEL